MRPAHKNAHVVIKSQYVTEKTETLLNLQHSESNRCTKACNRPKYVFIVDAHANKCEIKQALEEIYKEQKINVHSVNTLNTKPKSRRYRGRKGQTKAFKKAIVTLDVGDKLEDI